MAHESSTEAAAGLTALQKVALSVFSVALVGSLAARALLDGPRPAEGPAPAGAQGLAAGEGSGPPAEPGPLEELLPTLTEAALFGLIGFALGYTSRKLVRLALILVAIAFVAVQGAAHLGWLEVDWGGFLKTLGAWFLDLEERSTASEFLSHRLPSAGTLLVGWAVGFKRA